MKILYEDATMLAVDKPEGLSSIPERDLAVPSMQRTLEEARSERLFVVHRLDKDVSGLLLFARDPVTHRALSMAFEQRRVHKTYRAVTHGVIRDDRGVIERPIAQFGSGRMGVHDARGKPSQTEYAVVERYAAHSLVDAHPVTGRRHQLRVHFYAIGHPLLGDPRYGDPAEQTRWPRLMLHAAEIRIPLERTGAELRIECPAPPSFTDVLARLRTVTGGA
jgi:tRNA pseudouridine32 synthase / 23S rRNA pseudouridine746 synthase